MSSVLELKRAPATLLKKAEPDDPEKQDDLEYDLGNLCASDAHALNSKELAENKEEYLMKISRDNVQLLFNKVFQLPTEKTEFGPVADLPEVTSKIPREKPIPKKEETKWEKFAREKGIKKKKRSRMVFDEQTKEWKPIWGYGRAKKGMEDDAWVTED